MSGAEASLVLGRISSVITILPPTHRVYDAIFKKSASKLPIILKLLEEAEKRGILDTLQLIAREFLEVTTPRSKELLTTAIEDVSKTEFLLLHSFEYMPAFAHYGSGTQNNSIGGGTQNYNDVISNQNFIGSNYTSTLSNS
ncbi:hypothetical protein B0O99DRAFT_655655 [Bisporella sp. PMI_857]|nr:hypothetical protein B0O99DRAFT_655655 [Bisporella sp. PMI_857]